MKMQVGNAIFDFVQQFKGQSLAPKITGMLIDLNLDEIQGYLTNYREFQKKIGEAANLLDSMAKAAATGNSGPPASMNMPQPQHQMGITMPGMPQPSFH